MENLVLLAGFRGFLDTKLHPDDAFLPLDKRFRSHILSRMEEGDHTYLAIMDTRYYEIVKVRVECGELLMDRGQDGTTPRTFPCNAEVVFEMVPSVVRYMICNETCHECDCKPVQFQGAVLPPLEQGVAWQGSIVFSGDIPMTIGVQGAPHWMKVVTGANYIQLSGVPTTNTAVTISVAASNCGGELATRALTIDKK